MLSLFRSWSDRRLIDRGRVACPIRGSDAEIDVCAGCRWMLEIDENAALPFVRCAPRRVALCEADYANRWLNRGGQ